MTIITLKGNGEIRTGRTEIDAPHKEGTITFVYPMHGPSYHEKVMGEIDSDNLLRPTTAKTFSLLDLAINNPDEAFCSDILNKFKKNYLWSSTESVSFPKGVIVYDNSDGKMPQTSKGLLELIDAKDKRAGLVEPGFEIGVMPISEFLKNPYVIAQVGEDILEVVERVAKNCHKREAHVFALDRSNEDIKTYTKFFSPLSDNGLCLRSLYHGVSSWGGFASGVLKETK